MLVKCTQHGWDDITLGKVYEVRTAKDNAYFIKGDLGVYFWWPARFFEEVPTADSMAPEPERCSPLRPERLLNAAPVMGALRYNEGKGEHDYLLTYPGGIDAVFDATFDYYSTLNSLAEWYRGEGQTLDDVIWHLRTDAEEAGHDLASALAETNARGAAKYTVGNYLRGANYRQYCQSAIRHAQALQAGETHDAEGNNHLGALVFNILALDMCVTQKIGVDDRIRLPADTNPSTV